MTAAQHTSSEGYFDSTTGFTLERFANHDGKKDRAKTRLDELIKAYPDTKAAADAKKELEKLKD